MSPDRSPASPDPLSDAIPRFRQRVRPLATLAAIMGAAGCGVVIYCAWLVWFLQDPGRLVPMLARTVAVHGFLDRCRSGDNTHDVYLIGSSVLMHGIDCAVVDSGLPEESHSYNLGLIQTRPSHWFLLAPDLGRAGPGLVVVFLDLFAAPGDEILPRDRIAVAGWYGLLEAGDRAELLPHLAEDENRELASCRLRHLLTLRRMPYQSCLHRLRTRTRSDLRYGGLMSDFSSPWVQTVRIKPAQLLEMARSNTDAFIAGVQDDQWRNLDDINALLELLGCKGIPACLVVPPIHPLGRQLVSGEILDGILVRIRLCADRHHVPLIDHSGMLDEDLFLDFLHPAEDGRRLWSEMLARELNGILTSEGP